MNICFIGASGHTGFVLNGVKGRSDVRMTGIAPGCDGENIEGLQKKILDMDHPLQTFSDYRKMLDTLKPDIVVVAPWFGYHAKVAIDAMERGCHVFIEKPVATTLEDLEAVKEMQKRTGVHLAAMFGTRYSPDFYAAWKAVKEGAIGKIRLMNAQKSYKLGEREQFYKSRDTYGGTIPWVAIHAIDWLYWFAGEKFLTVFASHSAMYNRNHGDLEMSGICHYTFTNEVFASVSFDYLRPANAPSHDDDRIRIAGTEGVIEVRQGKVFLINGAAKGIQELPGVPAGNFFGDFMDQINGTGKCLVSAEDSFTVTEAALRARLSADEKRIVNF